MAQTPIFDELHRDYWSSPTPNQPPTPDTLTGVVREVAAGLTIGGWATLVVLALAVCGLVVVSVQNPGMALVTMLLFSVVFWAVSRILESTGGRS